ncbi:MAG: DUF721 domain-containing protein [Candidatus Magnetominusculus sp. LBB02]|nr:DUF721 domain-containing protein [Candidatus Magnetominusculus sp. LBB02]
MSRLQRAATVIESLAESLGMEDAMRLEKIKSSWHALIGPPSSFNCQPAFYKNAQLTINVSSNVWMKELSFHKDTFVSKLREFGVASVRLRPGSVEWPSPKAEPELPKVELSRGEIAYVESLSANIQDGELREILTRAALKSFTRIKALEAAKHTETA